MENWLIKRARLTPNRVAVQEKGQQLTFQEVADQTKKIAAQLERKKNLQQRIALIAHLQTSRNLGTQIMDEVARIVPAGVYLSKLEKQGPMLLIVGKSESNNRLSAMIREVESSKLLSEPLLEFIEAGKDQTTTLSDFKMHLRVKGYEAVQGDSKKSKTSNAASAAATTGK